jgi:hypothetical protein
MLRAIEVVPGAGKGLDALLLEALQVLRFNHIQVNGAGQVYTETGVGIGRIILSRAVDTSEAVRVLQADGIRAKRIFA